MDSNERQLEQKKAFYMVLTYFSYLPVLEPGHRALNVRAPEQSYRTTSSRELTHERHKSNPPNTSKVHMFKEGVRMYPSISPEDHVVLTGF